METRQIGACVWIWLTGRWEKKYLLVQTRTCKSILIYMKKSNCFISTAYARNDSYSSRDFALAWLERLRVQREIWLCTVIMSALL